MNDHNAAEPKYYTIGHVTKCSGLSDRTIRTYISMGILQGEKINGLWRFTDEQVGAFMSHPAVRPSILAKNNAVVYDFLLDDKKKTQQSCMILDFPGEEERRLIGYFCYAIRDRELHDFRFTLNSVSGVTRVILRGRTDELLELVSGYYNGSGSEKNDGTA